MKKNKSFNEEILFKYLWVIVICPKIVQFALLSFLLVFILGIRREKKDIFFVGIISFAVCHFIAMFISILSRNYEISRILAAFNTALVWILGACFYDYYKNITISIKKICKYMFINIIILILLGLVGYFLYSIVGVSEFYILGRRLIAKDYLFGIKSIRLAALLEHSNLVAMFYYITIPFALIYVVKNYKKYRIIFYFLSILPVLLCKSRIATIVSIICSIFSLLLTINSKRNKNIIYMLILGVVAILILSTNIDEEIIAKVNALINGRGNSTSARARIYMTSIKFVLENNILFGIGIKEMIGNYPLGSHSTYIGTFYKTGLIGTIIFSIVMLNMAIRYIAVYLNNKKLRFIIIYLISIYFSIAVLDIDGANWLLILWLAIFGIFSNKENLKTFNEYISN